MSDLDAVLELAAFLLSWMLAVDPGKLALATLGAGLAWRAVRRLWVDPRYLFLLTRKIATRPVAVVLGPAALALDLALLVPGFLAGIRLRPKKPPGAEFDEALRYMKMQLVTEKYAVDDQAVLNQRFATLDANLRNERERDHAVIFGAIAKVEGRLKPIEEVRGRLSDRLAALEAWGVRLDALADGVEECGERLDAIEQAPVACAEDRRTAIEREHATLLRRCRQPDRGAGNRLAAEVKRFVEESKKGVFAAPPAEPNPEARRQEAVAFLAEFRQRAHEVRALHALPKPGFDQFSPTAQLRTVEACSQTGDLLAWLDAELSRFPCEVNLHERPEDIRRARLLAVEECAAGAKVAKPAGEEKPCPFCAEGDVPREALTAHGSRQVHVDPAGVVWFCGGEKILLEPATLQESPRRFCAAGDVREKWYGKAAHFLEDNSARPCRAVEKSAVDGAKA